MTFLSAFAGVGGFDLALERVGMRCVGQIEIDPACRNVLARHFPEVDRHDDIRTAINWWAARARPPLDLLTGGFPCQDLSTANTGGRAGLAGQRSGLFFDLARAVGALRPRWLLLENVTGLLHCHQGRDFQAVLEELGALGYGVAWTVLDAQRFGLPQQRRRVFVVGCRGAVCPVEILFAAEPGPPGTAASGTPQNPPPATRAGRGPYPDRRDRAGDGIGTLYVIQAGGWSPLFWRDGGPAYTLNTSDRHLVAYTPPGQGRLLVRRLTPRECERLQGFPDDWTAIDADGRALADTIRYRMMGNAVAVPVVEWIGARLLAVNAPTPSS